MNIEVFTAQGWRTKRHTLTAAQTYLWGILFALPFVLLAGGLYRILLLSRAVLLNHTGPDPASCYCSQRTAARSSPWPWMETGRPATKRAL